MQRTLQAANIAGIRAFAVHAKDEEGRRFYDHFDFIPSPADPMTYSFYSTMYAGSSRHIEGFARAATVRREV